MSAEFGADETFPFRYDPANIRAVFARELRKDHDPRRQLLIHKAEGKLPESIFSETVEVDCQRCGASLIFSTA